MFPSYVRIRAKPRRTSPAALAIAYLSRLSTLCCAEFACARAEMPDWFKIVKRERFATSDGISAARMPSSALARFCTWLLMTLTADCRRLMPAPIEPRMPATLAIAVLMWVRAVWAAVPVVPASESEERFAVELPLVIADEEIVPTVTPIWLLELESDRKIDVVVAVNTDVP